jgi:serine/threonine-protein kinase RsbT
MVSRHDLSHAFRIKGRNFSKAGSVSIDIKEILRELGIDPAIVRRAAIAAYEAEMNVVMYADKGEMVLKLNPKMIRITLEDEGPGIEDIEMAMHEGYSTATEEMREMGFGAGMGLPNIKKNADVFELKSTVGKGTSYNIVIYLNPTGEI